MIHWLVGTLIATSGLMLLVLLTRAPVRRHFGPRIAYGLWLIPAARLLMPTLTQVAVRTPAVGMSAIIAPDTSLFARIDGWQSLMLALWLTGAVGLFVIWTLEFVRRRSAILSAAIHVDRIGSIRIVRTAAVTGPMALGIVDRVIALPADFETRYSEKEQALALAHELAHHRSGDLAANLAAFVLLCLYWFNPIAWFAYSAFRFDQEAACDARVLEHADADRADYGQAIAKAASGRAFLAAGALDRRGSLGKRLRCMLHAPPAHRRGVGKVMIMVALGVALPLTATRAITYVDAPFAQGPKAEGRLDAPLAAGAWFRVKIRAERAGLAQGKGSALVRAQSDAEGHGQDTAQASWDEEQAGKDALQAQADEERARSDLDAARKEQETGQNREMSKAARDAV